MRAAAWFLFLVQPVLAQDFSAPALSQRILTNESVVTLDELFIVERIRSSRTRFDMSVDGMVSLRAAGVTEDLIGVMALQDRRNRQAALSAMDTSSSGAVAAAAVPPAKIMVVRHWWGFRWVRVSQQRPTPQPP